MISEVQRVGSAVRTIFRRVAPAEIPISTGVAKPQEVTGRVASEIFRDSHGNA